MGCDMSFIKKVKMPVQGGSDHTTADSFEKRILLLGLDNAGKTSLVFQLKEN